MNLNRSLLALAAGLILAACSSPKKPETHVLSCSVVGPLGSVEVFRYRAETIRHFRDDLDWSLGDHTYYRPAPGSVCQVEQ